MQKESAWKTYGQKELEELNRICVRYKECLDIGKTERECVSLTVTMAKEAGYRDLKEVVKEKGTLKKGDKVYAVWMDKMAVLFQIGRNRCHMG